jgi:hypothetical protein
MDADAELDAALADTPRVEAEGSGGASNWRMNALKSSRIGSSKSASRRRRVAVTGSPVFGLTAWR